MNKLIFAMGLAAVFYSFGTVAAESKFESACKSYQSIGRVGAAIKVELDGGRMVPSTSMNQGVVKELDRTAGAIARKIKRSRFSYQVVACEVASLDGAKIIIY